MHHALSRALVALILLTLVAPLASAQLSDAIELTRQEIQAERQAIIANALELTDAQADSFWPLYREYRNDLAANGDRFVKLLLDYAENFGTIDDAKAQSILKEWFSIRQQKLKTQQRWMKKFDKVLPSKKVSLFYQVENKLDAIIDLDLAAEIPLIR